VTASPFRLLERPPRLTPQEAYALLLGAAALRRTGLPVFDQALARATDKIRALLSPSAASSPGLREAVAIDAGRPVQDQVFGPLSRASRERRAVELDYASVSGQRRRKIVMEPYGLLNHGGGWYVLGKSRTHREDRVFVFKLERIRSAAVLEDRFVVPPDFDLRKYRGDRMFIAGLAPVVLTLVFAAPFYVASSRIRWWQALIAGFVLANLFIVALLGAWAFIGLEWVAGILWFMGKTYAFVFTFVWMRGTLPRVRIDQLMDFAWKWLLPASLLNLFVTAAAIVVAKELGR
jgi:hypothetical protein